MSDGNRLQKYAIGLIAVIVVLLFLAVTHSKEREQDSERSKAAAANSGQTIDQFGRPRAGIPAIAESVISNPDPDQSNEREKRDLAAQESMSVWGFWTTFAALGTMFITLFGTILIWRQVSLTREAVEDTGKATIAMQRQNDLTESIYRPWLQITFGNTLITANGDKAEIWFEVIVKNIGQRPASKIGIAYRKCAAGDESKAVYEDFFKTGINAACAKESSISLLPNEERTFSEVIGDTWKKDGGIANSIYLVNITYQVNDAIIGRTSSSFIVWNRSSNSPFITKHDNLAKAIRAEKSFYSYAV